MMNSNSSMVMLVCFLFVYIYPSVGTSYSEDENIIYTNIAFSDYFDEFNTDSHYDSGLIFTRVRGPLYNKVFINETLNVFLENGFVPAEDFKTPVTLNHPGVGILDFDNDGDLDIFVTNGRGAAHSLFSNQLIENSGYFGEFIDVGNTSGFGDSTSISQEGSGVCFGDVNNDGFSDIMVLGRNDINLLYLNNGDSSFSVLLNSGIDNRNKTYNSSSCTFGDIDNDGYIDLFIGNSVNTEDATTIIRQLFVPSNPSLPFSLNEPNELYLNMFDSNTGIVSFEDVSDRVSGTSFPNPANNGESGITWAVIMADVNNDGLIDMIEANDQLGPSFDGPPNGPFFTQRRGINQVWFNDESNPGYFINKYILFVGSWMGISTGDLNCDDSLDIFLTNVGTYFVDAPEPGVSGKNLATKWFFNNNEENISNFEFVNDGESELFDFSFISPFGWGCAMYDYDIDGDLDILVHGGLDGALALAATNGGTLWRNDGDGCFNDSDVNVVSPESIFGIDPNCDGNGSSIPGCTYHTKRNVRGVAIGDLNDDGLYDIVTTSDFVYSEDFELLRYNQVNVTSPFDNVVKNGDILYNSSFWLELLFSENENGDFVWNGKETLEGDLFVEIAQIQNKNKFKNKSFKLLLKGSKGLLTDGNVNRDGIGAIITVDVKNSDKRTTVPITGGESHLSQHSFEKVFGLGKKNKGDVIIKWPKGTGQGRGYNVNKLDDVKNNEKLTLYELPCDYESRYDNFNEYKTCVTDSLNQLYYQPLSQNKLQKRICKSMGISTSECNSLLY